jgi:hypothetical protein
VAVMISFSESLQFPLGIVTKIKLCMYLLLAYICTVVCIEDLIFCIKLHRRTPYDVGADVAQIGDDVKAFAYEWKIPVQMKKKVCEKEKNEKCQEPSYY